MPATAKEYGVRRSELFNENINIQVSLYYFRTLFREFGRYDLALAAYNAGPTRVKNAGNRVPRIHETRQYIRRVQQYVRRSDNANNDKRHAYTLRFEGQPSR
jgi:soluble lytic murein transglycosylase-like protein